MIEREAWQAAEELFLDAVDRAKVLPWSRRAAMRRPDTIFTVPAGGTGGDRVPYAYRLDPSQLRQRGHPAYGAGIRDAFFADEACAELICRTFTEAGGEAEAQRYTVVDHDGRQIGAIERIPRRNALSRHGWRLRQPGQPELLAGDPPLLKRMLRAAPGKALEIVIQLPFELLLGGGGGGGAGDTGIPDRSELEWWTRPDEPRPVHEKALTMLRRERQDRPHPWRVWVSWLDRRLVLAQMLIPDR